MGHIENYTEIENNDIVPLKHKISENNIFTRDLNSLNHKTKNNKFDIIPIIGMGIGILIYFGSLFTLYFVLFGSNLLRLVLALLLIYQYCFAKRNETYRRFLKFLRVWDYFAGYTIYSEEDLKISNSLFSFHPHGILAYGAAMSGAGHEILYNSIFCGSRAMINIPLSGIFARWIGVQGVNNANFKEFMRQGKNISFVPGGFEEATITKYNHDRIYIKCRKGFIKYALEFGYTIYPIYTFNENKVYSTFDYFENFRLFLNKIKIPGTLFYSKYFFFPNPNIHLYTIIGKSIKFPQIVKPTKEDVDKYHLIYLEAVKDLYNKYKTKFGRNDTLEIL